MTSIVVSLYFKQENCGTLISLYNWGRMKHCQSELVSRKVEWFCSLAVFSRWPGLSLFLSVSVCLFLCSLLALCSSLFFFEKHRKGSTREGQEVRVALLEHQLWPITVAQVHVQYLLHAVWLWETDSSRLQPPAGLATSATTCFHCRLTTRSLHLLLVCIATVFVLICSQLNEKQILSSLSCCIKPSANSKVCCAITHCLCGVMKTCSVVRLFVQDA